MKKIQITKGYGLPKNLSKEETKIMPPYSYSSILEDIACEMDPAQNQVHATHCPKNDGSPRKTVSFDLSNSIVVVVDMQEDKSITWLSREELESFKLDCAKVVQMILRGQSYRYGEACCQRGLENMSMAGSLQSKSRRRHACKAVLREQEQQRQAGVVDADMISRVYHEATKRSALSAFAQGRRDAELIG